MKDDSTKRYYETHADEYFQATYAADLQPLWEKLSKRLEKDAYILDLGSGSGRDLRHFANQGFRVIGIDYSAHLVELARAFSEQPVVLGDISALPFEDESFDAVWAIGSLLHTPLDTISAVFCEVHRVLKPDSYFLSSVKKGHGETIDTRGRYNVLYTSDEWANIHEATGFEVIGIEETIEPRTTESGGAEEIVWIECLARTRDR
jgi:SAM-dependent methyltransferase